MTTMTKLTRHLHCRACRNAGFTLIEVLVSIVILSIGLLGIAKLMLVSSHANDSAYLRSQATALAYEILDNMRANRQEAINQPTYVTAALPVVTTATALGFSCYGAAQCTTTQLGQFDIYQWKLRLNTASNPGGTQIGALPNGEGSVAIVTVNGQTTATIQVFWDDTIAQTTFGAAAAPQQSVTLETVL
jgi:type IV pilus assembly protein PilV